MLELELAMALVVMRDTRAVSVFEGIASEASRMELISEFASFGSSRCLSARDVFAFGRFHKTLS